MKRNNLFLSVLMFVITLSCNAQNKSYSVAYKGFDFVKVLESVSSNEKSDSTNIINFQVYFVKSKPFLGTGRGFMIHKKGIKYWYNYAQEHYKSIGKYDGINYGYEKSAKMLIGKDSILLKDFNKWMFFTDKKYLKQTPGTGEWDAGSPEALANKPLPVEYYEKENTKIEILLLEQKAGEHIWHIIDKATFETDEYGGYKSYIDKNRVMHNPEVDWTSSFKRQKIHVNQ